MTTTEHAAAAFAEGYLLLDDPTVTVAEAARRAYTPTGPSLDELEARIAARRALQSRTPASVLPRAALTGQTSQQ